MNWIHRLVNLTTAAFFVFLVWIIHLADSGKTMPFFQMAKSTPYGDKIGHFILFGFFAFLLILVFRWRGFWAGPLFIPYGALLVVVLVVVEEASQRWFPGRTCAISLQIKSLTKLPS